MLRLTKKDKAVMRAFVDGRAMSSKHLESTSFTGGRGLRLDIVGMGGHGAAHRDAEGNVCITDLGSRSGQTVQRALGKLVKTSWCKNR
jgi:hypothetical protein